MPRNLRNYFLLFVIAACLGRHAGHFGYGIIWRCVDLALLSIIVASFGVIQHAIFDTVLHFITKKCYPTNVTYIGMCFSFFVTCIITSLIYNYINRKHLSSGRFPPESFSCVYAMIYEIPKGNTIASLTPFIVTGTGVMFGRAYYERKVVSPVIQLWLTCVFTILQLLFLLVIDSSIHSFIVAPNVDFLTSIFMLLFLVVFWLGPMGVISGVNGWLLAFASDWLDRTPTRRWVSWTAIALGLILLTEATIRKWGY